MTASKRTEVVWTILRDVETWRWNPRADVDEVYPRIHAGLTSLLPSRKKREPKPTGVVSA